MSKKQNQKKKSGTLSQAICAIKHWYNKPTARSLYIVQQGKYVGSALIFFNSIDNLKDDETVKVLRIDQTLFNAETVSIIEIPKAYVFGGIERGIIKRATKVSKPIYSILSQEYHARLAKVAK